MFEIKCSTCGKPAMVPFKPTVNKPVFCKECFSKHTSERPKTTYKANRFNPKQAWARRR
ncbi:MAG TPA: CxxC-x17-CxxC domain-containing protein [Candidatus Sulfotelmatobacter sp.]|nr:CxxC-x17-CxxC domain-containing protein [Candidatus Sulfotelmatobacter sp.]